MKIEGKNGANCPTCKKWMDWQKWQGDSDICPHCGKPFSACLKCDKLYPTSAAILTCDACRKPGAKVAVSTNPSAAFGYFGEDC